MTTESLRNRIGVDLGNKRPIEEGVQWAAENEVFYFDFKINDDGLPHEPEAGYLFKCNPGVSGLPSNPFGR